MKRVTIGTGTMRHPTLDPDEGVPDSVEPRLCEASELVCEAARRGCDFLCLPELFADPTQGAKMEQWAEPLGGPITTWLATMARQHKLALISTVTLTGEGGVANTALVYDSRGLLAGRYQKVHLPEGENAIAGREFDVVDVDGVCLGLQICHDLSFPEGSRILALNGAKVIFWPNMWGGMPEYQTDVIMRARAIENAVFLVSSAYVLTGSRFFRVPKVHGRSCIIDPSGAILAEVGNRCGVAVATVDLDEEVKWQTLGTRKNQLDERRPHLYGRLTR